MAEFQGVGTDGVFGQGRARRMSLEGHVCQPESDGAYAARGRSSLACRRICEVLPSSAGGIDRAGSSFAREVGSLLLKGGGSWKRRR